MSGTKARGRGVPPGRIPAATGAGLLSAVLGALAASGWPAGAAAAQDATPTPQLLQQAQSQCPADARISYDVTSIAGADGVRWQLGRGAPGSTPTWESAEPLANGQQSGSSGIKRVFLRNYGATMNGTPYLARVRATQGGQNVAEWSEPSAPYAPSHSPDGMYQASGETGADGAPRIRLQWNLTGALAACADRIRYEVKKDAPFASPTGPDPAAQAGSFTGTTGNQLVSLPGGAGEYYVRLVVRHGGDSPDKDVGTWGAALGVTVQPATLAGTPTPELLQQDASECPADARIRYNVTSIAGADGIEWELRRGTAGATSSWGSAQALDQGQNGGAQASKRLFLRTYGATMNGTPYLARIRAIKAGQPVAEWSEPATYAPSYAPDGMYTVASELAADGTPRVRLQWNLTGEIAACADRIGYHLSTGNPALAATPAIPALAVRSASGKSGSALIDPSDATTTTVTSGRAVSPTGGGALSATHYYVRIVAAYQGDPTRKAVSAWSKPAWTPIPEPPPTTASCGDLDPSLAPSAEMFSATPVVQTTSPPYRLRIDWNLSGTLAACADRITYEVRKGAPFASAALDPLTYMAETLSGTSGSYLAILPEGPDEYWVRILARRGGDTPNQDVGRRSPAKQVAVAATTRHELAVKVIDDVESSCAGGTVVLPDATVRLTLPDGSRQSATTDVQGIARLSALAGQYTLSASRQGCGSDSGPLILQADHETSLRLPKCVSEGADLALLLTSTSTSPTGGEPYPLTVTVRSIGSGASGPANITLERSDGTRTTRLLEAGVPQLCRGLERSFAAEDPSPEAGKTYTYTARLHPRSTDTNRDNNAASRTVAFAAPLEPVTPVEGVPATPMDFPATSRNQPLFSRTAPAGWSYDFFCGPGAVLVGIHGNADQWIDRIGATCARVDRNGQWVGEPYPVRLLGTIQSETVGLSIGGEPFDQQCPRDQAVVAVSGRNSLLTAFSAVILTCRSLSGGPAVPAGGPVGTFGGDAVWDERCDGPAKGLLVDAALYVDVAIPDCDTPLVPSRVGPVRPRLVQVRTRLPTFEWTSAPLALEYRLCVNPTRTASNTYECGPGNLIVWTRGTSWTPGEDLPLATSGDIPWVVHACDEAFCTRGVGTTFTYRP